MRDLRKIDKHQAKREAGDAKQSVEQLRDEIRLRIHLGGMELKEAFEKLEHEADHLVAKAEPTATRAIQQVAARLRQVAHALDGKQ